jgi:hypothetical protein
MGEFEAVESDAENEDGEETMEGTEGQEADHPLLLEAGGEHVSDDNLGRDGPPRRGTW